MRSIIHEIVERWSETFDDFEKCWRGIFNVSKENGGSESSLPQLLEASRKQETLVMRFCTCCAVDPSSLSPTAATLNQRKVISYWLKI